MLTRAARPLASVLLALLLAGCVTTVPGSPAPRESGWTFVGEEPCDDAGVVGADEFSCVTLSVPVDHAEPTGEHWDVTFGLRRADGDSRGVLVTATGGPGSSGLSVADLYLGSRYPAAVAEQYDTVFFDQRGIGLSQEFRCDDTYYGSFAETVDTSSTAADRTAYAEAATTFGQECFTEAGVDPATAPRYATRQAVEDLEDFREWLGAPALVLYGESYGTQYVQTYAAAHPDRVERVVVDGVVDLTTDIQDFALGSARADSEILARTLLSCDTQPACADEAPGTSLAAYDELQARLAAEPVTLDDGTVVDEVTLKSAAFGWISDPYSRTELQVAVNEAVLGDYSALVDLAEDGGGFGPTDDFSDALFYAVECQDYDFVPQGGDGAAALDGWLDRAAAEGVDQLRLGDYYYGDTPCHFWPGVADSPDVPRPAPVTDPPYPVLVVNADADPNTPVAGALGVFRDLTPGQGPEDALVLLQGGFHVVWGAGDPCVDGPVDAFVLEGTVPAERFTNCPGDIADPYP